MPQARDALGRFVSTKPPKSSFKYDSVIGLIELDATQYEKEIKKATRTLAAMPSVLRRQLSRKVKFRDGGNWPNIEQKIGAREMAQAATPEMVEQGFRVLDRAKELVPFRDGDLYDSGAVYEPDVAQGIKIRVPIAFGGEDAPYAAVQHEGFFIHPTAGRVDFREYTIRGTGPKYLEKAMLEHAGKIARALAAKLRTDIRKVGAGGSARVGGSGQIRQLRKLLTSIIESTT